MSERPAIMKRLAAYLFAIFLSEPALAQSGHPSIGYQQITSLASATSLTVPTTGGPVVWALICAETAGVRWRDDGPAPTATVGQPLAAGQCFQYAGPLTAIQFIAQTGSPVLDVSYYR
jgi:hypothetical protein